MDSKVLEFTSNQVKKDLPDFQPGQTVRVHQKVREGDKERIQVFEGTVIAIKGDSPVNRTLHVRKVSEGVGVERIFPVNSPLVEKIEVTKSGKVRRAKLYYIRKKERKIKDDEKKQERVEKAAQELEAQRKKEADLKAQREVAQKAADEEAKKKVAQQSDPGQGSGNQKEETAEKSEEKKDEAQKFKAKPEPKQEEKTSEDKGEKTKVAQQSDPGQGSGNEKPKE